MATSLEELHAKRDELVKALGVAGIRTGEDSIQYGNIEKAIDAIDREIARATAAASGTTASRRTVATFNPGF